MMWARVVEVMLACWLAVSPFIFRHGGRTELWVSDLGCAAIVMTLALASFWRPMRYAHGGIAVVAIWLVAFGYFRCGSPPPAAAQNDILTGLLLLMFAIVPNDASQPPTPWRRARERAIAGDLGAASIQRPASDS
ncbi:hypothetical protein WME73_48865 [Sorangium sp. So ce302]|uniref:SPW repeat domain-containing protein n=1 Tax=Sorangium sp. So ce302 TaxID=3133297 RepID=UPI003F610E2A